MYRIPKGDTKILIAVTMVFLPELNILVDALSGTPFKPPSIVVEQLLQM